MKCLETRATSEGYKRRRYQRDDGTRFTTIEVPIEIWRYLNRQGRDLDRARQHARAVAREALRTQSMKHKADGWKAIASAHRLSIPLRTVQRWWK